jgi:hypothetical protein
MVQNDAAAQVAAQKQRSAPRARATIPNYEI